MDKLNTVHCMFEQSGTFKNEFKKLGFKAYDYDLQDEFGETDCRVDLFDEIHKAFEGWESIFDRVGGGGRSYYCIFPLHTIFSEDSIKYAW